MWHEPLHTHAPCDQRPPGVHPTAAVPVFRRAHSRFTSPLPEHPNCKQLQCPRQSTVEEEEALFQGVHSREKECTHRGHTQANLTHVTLTGRPTPGMAAFYQVHHRVEPPAASEAETAVTLGKYRIHQKGPGDCVVLVMSLLDWRRVGKHTHNMCIFLEYLCHTVKTFPPKCNLHTLVQGLAVPEPCRGA